MRGWCSGVGEGGLQTFTRHNSGNPQQCLSHGHTRETSQICPIALVMSPKTGHEVKF